MVDFGIFYEIQVDSPLKHPDREYRVFHEVLEHRWYLSENQGRDVGLDEAVSSYIGGVLVHKPDEAAVLGVDTEEIPVVSDMFDEDGLDASPQPLPGTSGASAN